MHHIVTDAWSSQILARELPILYTAFSNHRPSPLAELPITYGDYSEWQREWFKSAKVQEQTTFWKNELEDAPPLLTLGIQRPRGSEQTFAGSSQLLKLDAEVITAIKALAVRLQATPFMLLLAAFKVLLLRASGQSDLLVGVPVAGRNRMEVEGLVGFFVNTLVMRNDLSGNPNFSELVGQVRETTLRAFANSDVPFEKVVEALQPERNLSYNPIFQVMFSVIKAAVQSHAFGDLEAWPYIVSPNSAIFDLHMAIIEGVDGVWWAQVEHNTDLFPPEDMKRLLDDYGMLLRAVTSSPETNIADLPATVTAVKTDPRAAAKRQAARSSRDSVRAVAGPRCRTTSRHSNTPKRRKARALTQTQSTWRQGVPVEALPAEEKLLLNIWKDLLHTTGVGIDDNFFDIGGHSLLAAQVIAQVQTATNRKIPVSAIFRAPTIRAFANLLREGALIQPEPIAMRLSASRSPIAFFGVAVPGVDTFGFAQLARHLPTDQPLYKLQASAPVVFGRPRTVEELQALATRYIEAMRSEQPHGPYCLGAMCDSVLVAQEMILQLEAQGEEVALFTIFDTWVLENSQIRSLWAVNYYMDRLRVFGKLSLGEQVATMCRVMGRLTSRKQTNADPGRGWSRVYWPDENFQPPRFHAPVLLFKRPRQPYFYVRDPQMGWGARSMGGVTTFELECGHAEMLREPYVRQVGESIASRLEMIKKQQDVRSVISRLATDLNPGFDSGLLAGTAA
jgi:thioesterase domain-containing protein